MSNKVLLNLTRIIIQTTAPLAINSGDRELGFDTQLQRDHNNLPYIPGESIAGVWKHIVANKIDEDTANLWFGSSNEKSDASDESQLIINSGFIHNSENKAMYETQLDISDTLLSMYRLNNPVARERVKLTDNLTASHEGKFDQLMLPRGTRFSIDVRWFNEKLKDKENQWQEILECWEDRSFALGSSASNGFGRFKIIEIYDEQIDLTENKNAEAQDTIIKYNLKEEKLTRKYEYKTNKKTALFAIKLKSTSKWRFGSSTHLLKNNKTQVKPKLIGYSEPIIEWKNEKATITKPQPIICGSSIKGILAHRITFHYNRLTQNWAEDFKGDWQQRPETLNELFGQESGNNTSGHKGLMEVPDCLVSYNNKAITHRSHITKDSVTTGTLPQNLYNQELLEDVTFTLKAYWYGTNNIDDNLNKAIKLTLDDLVKGRLSIGTGTGRGASLTKIEPNSKIDFDEQQLTKKEVNHV